jgi:hypothetical protein
MLQHFLEKVDFGAMDFSIFPPAHGTLWIEKDAIGISMEIPQLIGKYFADVLSHFYLISLIVENVVAIVMRFIVGDQKI